MSELGPLLRKVLASEIPGKNPPGNRITMETVDQVTANGYHQVRGYTLPVTGQQTFKTGDQVAVAWKNGVPVAILGHHWRRAQFHPPVILPAGDIQTVAAIVQDGAVFLVLSSAAQGNFAFPLANLNISFSSPADARAKWVEPAFVPAGSTPPTPPAINPDQVVVIYTDTVAGVVTQHAVIVKLPREVDDPSIQFDATLPPDEATVTLTDPVTEQAVEMPVLKASLAAHYTMVPATTVARTLRVDVQFRMKVWRYLSEALGLWGPADPSAPPFVSPPGVYGAMTEYAGLSIESDGISTATGKPVRLALGASCQDFFAVKAADGTIDVLLTYADGPTWRPGAARTSEQLYSGDAYGQFASGFTPSLCTFISSFPTYRPDTSVLPDAYGYKPWAYPLQPEPLDFPPDPVASFLYFSDDQRPQIVPPVSSPPAWALTPWDIIFRCPHLYQFNMRTQAFTARNVSASTVLTVTGHRYLAADFCVPWWSPNYSYMANPTVAQNPGILEAQPSQNDIGPNMFYHGQYWMPHLLTRIGQWGGVCRHLDVSFPPQLDGGGWWYPEPQPGGPEGNYSLYQEDTISQDPIPDLPDIIWGVQFDTVTNPYILDPWMSDFAAQMQVVEVKTIFKIGPEPTGVIEASVDELDQSFSEYYWGMQRASKGPQVVLPRAAANGTQYATGFFGGGQPPATETRWINKYAEWVALSGVTVAGGSELAGKSGGPFGDLQIARNYARTFRGVALPLGLAAAQEDGGSWPFEGTVAYRVAIQRTILRVVPPSTPLSSETIQLPACAPLLVQISDKTQQVTLTWTATPDATSYLVYRLDPDTDTYGLVGTVAGPTGHTFTDTGITAGAAPPAPLGLEGAVTLGGPAAQEFYGAGLLGVLYPPSAPRGQLVRLVPAPMAVLGTPPIVPQVLRINTRWALFFAGTKTVYAMALPPNPAKPGPATIYQVDPDDVALLLSKDALAPGRVLTSAKRLFWSSTTASGIRNLLQTSVDLTQTPPVGRWNPGREIKAPVQDPFPFGDARTAKLIPGAIDDAE